MKLFRWTMAALSVVCLVLLMYGSVKLARAETPPPDITVDPGIEGVTATVVDPQLQNRGMTLIGIGGLGLIAGGAGLIFSYRKRDTA